MDYINYINATYVIIQYYYNGVKQSYYFDDAFIIDSRLKTYEDRTEFEKLLNTKIFIDKCAMMDELPYMKEENISYVVKVTDYFLPNDEKELRLRTYIF